MDSLLVTPEVLNHRNWIYFKIYKNPTSHTDFMSILNWYHQVLIEIVRPLIINNNRIRAVFFGIYGPSEYEFSRREEYERRIEPPDTNVVYIRLRLSVEQNTKNDVKNEFINEFQNNGNLVWNYETMVTFDVRHDLGRRYGSNDDIQTLQFIRYWDAACRYILSIVTLPGNWIPNVDVWGIPHLVNNSLGSLLRPRGGRFYCPKCSNPMYMFTMLINLQNNVSIGCSPSFVFICPNCGYQDLRCINI